MWCDVFGQLLIINVCLCQFDYISLKVMHEMFMQLFPAVKRRLQTAVDDVITLMLVYAHMEFLKLF